MLVITTLAKHLFETLPTIFMNTVNIKPRRPRFEPTNNNHKSTEFSVGAPLPTSPWELWAPARFPPHQYNRVEMIGNLLHNNPVENIIISWIAFYIYIVLRSGGHGDPPLPI
jgi:hypothetical protein